MREHLPRQEHEGDRDPAEGLPATEKFEVLLGLFGTVEARNNFLSLCHAYYEAREGDDMRKSLGDAENYRPPAKEYSPPRRSGLHNAIMETVARLATETKRPTALQTSVLREFRSREAIAAAIRNYLLHEDDGDEDENEKPKDEMSGPAYFHSLGKEH